AGQDARLAGWAAATQRELLPARAGRVDVAVPPHRRVALPGVAVHRTSAPAEDWDLAGGIPTHTVARLLLDLAMRHDPATVEWAWRQAIYRQVLDVQEITGLLDRQAGGAGAPVVRALLARREALVGDIRNRFELLMLEIIREAGLPEPLVNAPLAVGRGLILRPDFRIPELRLVVESDGRDGHDDVEFLLSDEERDALYAGLGYRTLRFGYWEAKRERGRVVAGLRAAGVDARRIVPPGAGRSSVERAG
ncbi:MAG: hypothetical protein JWM31_2703, partial [Solirubrobacterales bacterium]|nr:hypothetical protein [Solirubrobacterales bacterium]